MSEFPAARDDASAPFFDGTARGELLVRACPACGHLRPPFIARGLLTGVCNQCGHDDLGWRATAGAGTLVSWTTAHRRDPSEPLTVLGIVELDEGPWIFARLVDVPHPPEIGAPLEVAFVRPADGESIPVFRPAGSDRGAPET